MGLKIQLLGRASIAGSAGLRGKKAWALLAYLLACDHPPSRDQLAALLFEEADDPLRALRWNLSELRKALPGVEFTPGDELRVALPPDAVVDLQVLKAGSWVEAIELEGLGRELLEGVHLSSSPTMESWLLNERRHVKGATEAILREAVMALLGLDRGQRAVELATRLVALDPLDESYRALLIRSLKKQGEDEAAQQEARAYTRLLQRELGVAPGAAIAEALSDADDQGPGPAPADRAGITAKIEAAQAAARAGQVETALRTLKTAVAAAHGVGDDRLRAKALLAAGSALVHTDRSNHEEGSALLHQVIPLAETLDEPAMVAAVHRELAWVEFMAARYERACRWIYKAPAEALEDAATRAGALWILGKSAAETGRYEESFELLDSAVAQARKGREPVRLGFCLTAVGRGRLICRDLDPAAEALTEAIEVVRFAGLVAFAALPEAFLGEVRLLQGDADAARELLEHSLAAAREVGDPTMEALSLRSHAMLALDEDDVDKAVQLLQAARTRLVESPDHTWTYAYVLDRLADVTTHRGLVDPQRWVDELANLAGRTGMKEMLERAYIYRHRLGDPNALDAAKLLAHEVDNPQLQLDLKAAGELVGASGRVSRSST